MHTFIVHPCFMSLFFITAAGSNILPLRYKIEASTPRRVNFNCLFDDASSDVTQIIFWYKPAYPTSNKIILYRWTSTSNEAYVFDPLMQQRINVSVEHDIKSALLSISNPVLHDSGTYHCEMTFSSEKRSSLALFYRRTNTDVESVQCESVEYIYGKTGVISCFYIPTFSSVSFIIWSRLVSLAWNEIYKYSFLHARGQQPQNLPWLHDRVIHELDVRSGKTTLRILNTRLSDAGLYKVEVQTGFTTLTKLINISVEDLSALQLMVSSSEKSYLTISGNYHYQAFSVSVIEWYLVDCEKESLLLKHDVLKNKTQISRDGISHNFNNRTGQFYLIWKDINIVPLVVICNMTTSQGPLHADISIQYIKGMEDHVKPIINTWPEPVSGEDAKAVCRRMCSVLPDMSSIYVNKHIIDWVKSSNLNEVWISKENTSIASIGKIKSPSKCFVIQPNNPKPKERLCMSRTQLICINLKHTETPLENKQGVWRNREEGIWFTILISVIVPGIVIVSVLTSVAFAILRWMSNKKEAFRRPWENKKYPSEEIPLSEDFNNQDGRPLLNMDLSLWKDDFEKINAHTEEMLRQQPETRPVVVGIMSSGFDMKHPIFNAPLPPPRHHIAVKEICDIDRFGQGTFLAGVIIEQCRKVLEKLQLVNLQAVTKDGEISTNSVQSCLQYCAGSEKLPDIILIPNCFTEVLSSNLRPLLEKLMGGTVVVLSASNDVTSPVDLAHIGILANLVIGSHNERLEKCKDSPTYWGVDFLAPGSYVTSAKAGSEQYTNGNGTVVAAAWACGILVHVMLQARYIAKKYKLSVQYTTWMMHNVLLAMTGEKVRIPGNGYGPLMPGRVLLNEEKLKSIIRAASV